MKHISVHFSEPCQTVETPTPTSMRHFCFQANVKLVAIFTPPAKRYSGDVQMYIARSWKGGLSVPLVQRVGHLERGLQTFGY